MLVPVLLKDYEIEWYMPKLHYSKNMKSFILRIIFNGFHPIPLGNTSIFKIYLLLLEDNYSTILWCLLPHINMNLPRVRMLCVPPPWTTPLHLLRHPIPLGCPRAPALGALHHTYIKLTLVVYFTYGNMYISVLFSQIIPPSLPTESKSLFFTSVSPLRPHPGSTSENLILQHVY